MDAQSDFVDWVETAADQWTDGRVIAKADLADLVLFHVYGAEYVANFGYGLCGWVMRERSGECLMTVKLMDRDIPLVVFITHKTPTACIAKFLQLLEKDNLTLAPDKYPWT